MNPRIKLRLKKVKADIMDEILHTNDKAELLDLAVELADFNRLIGCPSG